MTDSQKRVRQLFRIEDAEFSEAVFGTLLLRWGMGVHFLAMSKFEDLLIVPGPRIKDSP
jgi:hypothetical protein